MLHQVASYLCLLPELPEGQDTTYEKEFLLELLVSAVWVFMTLPKRAFEFLRAGSRNLYLGGGCLSIENCLVEHFLYQVRLRIYFI